MTGPLTVHDAERAELPGPYGPIAALSTRGAGKATALLVPGYTGSKEDFAPLLDDIAADGFRAVAIDLPGQFESPGPDDESAYLPAALGQVVAATVEHLATEGKPVLLLGHSYGGLVARAAVLAGAGVAGLTLMDTGPSALPEGPRRTALSLGEPLLRKQGIEAAYGVREQMNERFPSWTALPAELKAFYRHRFVSSSPAGLLGMADGLRYEPDLVEALRARNVPSLVVAGEGDDAWSVAAQQDMAARLNAPFALVPHAAHSPNIENPKGLLGVLLPAWRSWL
ncbi:alpha/beta hydrolase [Amycolatopsis acidiphila]|uniref:Alpha/beta fold hydrolase n=1 Tax=Amycolatopsis acidiphila TaxID=715473 RepID=A0A558A047_9PSEU|nr:alpha/beta hydrolase [Amycolatopsis acidiphila]TVT17624.1 alpha/beta fold hydrolase [Amycolatopsis acidiphila]UIJ60979.1 alpha/beta hydrolase [Amycolatopsis acidiphila]GHG88626.1 alpha/beta hydrolase [Amycolatopsis acidiphila]